MTDTQAAALRAYMQKGGFVIVDDFKAEGDFGSAGWGPFEANMRRVLPGVRFVPMSADASDLPLVLRDRQPRHHPAGLQRREADTSSASTKTTIRSKRLMMIVNYNTDISQSWEWSGTGLRPIDDTNEAYKLGVNYCCTA